MDAKQIFSQAHEALVDAGHSPRAPLMLALSGLIDAPEPVTTGDIHLTATVEPGGACTVRDQHGRLVAGVKAVAAYTDPQSGEPTMQVTL